MTDREERIQRWMGIASVVFEAEDAISPAWDSRLRAAERMDKRRRTVLAEQYLRAIAEKVLQIAAGDGGVN